MAEPAAGNASEEELGRARSPPLPPDSLIIVPVRGIVLFPGTALPIALGRRRSVIAAQRAVREQKPVGIVMQRNAEVDDPLPVDLHRMGTVANIVRYITAPDGTHHLVCQGEQRFRVVEYLTGWPFFVAETMRIPEPVPSSDEIEARFVHLKRQAVEAVQLLPQAPNELLTTIQGSRVAGRARRHGGDLHGRDAGREAGNPRDRRSRRPIGAGARDSSRIGSRFCGCRRRSAAKPRRRSTPAIARSCCASRWRPFSVSSAKRTRERPPKSPNSKRRSATPRCRRRSRTRPARSCGVCSACRRPPANTAWCEPISTGWSNCPGAFPRRRRSTSRRRGASSTRITSISRRSSAGSSNIWPSASWPRAARRRSSASSDRRASARRRSVSRSRAP